MSRTNKKSSTGNLQNDPKALEVLGKKKGFFDF